MRESAELIHTWLLDSSDDIRDGTLIIHDDGNAFSDILMDNEFKSKSIEHVTYPVEVHEMLSPNDNGGLF